MIISASRRTDLPAYYSGWLFERLRQGEALVRNPLNPRRVSRVSLRPGDVDGIVFWTKDPGPMLGRLAELSGYAYYFQFTLTGYGPEVEPRVADKQKVLVPAFRRLAQAIGPGRVVWRYDPIFLSKTYTFDHHLRSFEALARQLQGCSDTCVISFLDFYRGTAKRMADLALEAFPPAKQEELAAALAPIAEAYGFAMESCAERLELARYGIRHGRCIDPERLGRILHCPLRPEKDKNQRPACGCAPSVDIGAYDTCPGGCLYCYADHGRRPAPHDPASPLLAGALGPQDLVSERKERTLRETQLRWEEL
ncbi:DUF1848 domain-containing protein [Allofournierella sp.]|uniref:DUF1848 domain-containing protein n=1 Tax=Allofournierella sp. TaxID=1940256 RepID=UPI003AB612FE